MRGPTEMGGGLARAPGAVAARSAASAVDELHGVDELSVGRRAERFGTTFPEVLAAAQADSPWAYRRLFDWLARPVAGYLRGQGSEDPDGLANDVFLRVFTNLRGFQGDEDRFRSWVFTIAHNGLVDERRRRCRRPVVADRPVEEHGARNDTEAAALDRVGAERVRRLLGGLSADQRDVLLLRIVADLTVEQAAGALGKTPGAVKQLQRRGLAVLRRRLEEEAGASGLAGGSGPDRRTPAATSGVHPSAWA
ncbi:MAG: sigma-70 family RNA polymerase sigma factor [Actinomycetota bacterium]|nr:sigma-70 family RNA polymerase sigma factor [Actinomycetota bacterium]